MWPTNAFRSSWYALRLLGDGNASQTHGTSAAAASLAWAWAKSEPRAAFTFPEWSKSSGRSAGTVGAVRRPARLTCGQKCGVVTSADQGRVDTLRFWAVVASGAAERGHGAGGRKYFA